MPATADRTTAAQYVARLRANTDALYADAVDYPTFGERNRAIWDAVEQRGQRFKDRVLDVLNGRVAA